MARGTGMVTATVMATAVRVLPLVLVVSALSSLLFYWRLLPFVVNAFARLLMRATGATLRFTRDGSRLLLRDGQQVAIVDVASGEEVLVGGEAPLHGFAGFEDVFTLLVFTQESLFFRSNDGS